MSEVSHKRRPEFRNIHISQILGYRLPIAGIMSILHRVSGAGMFLTLPILIYVFDLSITSELSYFRLIELTELTVVKLFFCGIAWAFIHHFMGGIRHLVNDLHMGLTKEASPLVAQGFLAASLTCSAVAWLTIFGVI
ncbi:MAG: succinate dehydrogenase, cytochrome b556 subunit [Betaproteobacteria bacterium]|nr:succinate dehydrogenase, cytochrome b556 subunit [Betaproteobacteria bacterium]NBT75667.1 succinate dehydrogenase, cytochrome b556 subunit [Betaproteobacteria bacterium]NBY13882.1 succinate dehydrogenase, cytochrome b556 subunit [Betaproteobacteria bacterium]NCA15829.1 succinate dehydrogenase, cytochrome b556 subunit [Betaproteobacteria bacterium]NDF03574.1 succinate dehydrogenase, cytochrome b556 subunit [Betaproteobacteria bacterium]